MKGRIVRLMCVLAVAVGTVGVPAATAQTTDCATVKVKLVEYKIKLSTKSVDAGCVNFKVINRGVEDHEVIVTKANSAHDIPNKKGVVKEHKVDIIGQTGELKTLKRNTLSLTLAPGKYVLFCNLLHQHDHEHGDDDGGMDMSNPLGHNHEHTKSESHFGEGMHTVFTVN